MSTLLIVVLLVILLAVLPTWPHSRKFGYGPSGIVGVLLGVLILVMVLGYI